MNQSDNGQPAPQKRKMYNQDADSRATGASSGSRIPPVTPVGQGQRPGQPKRGGMQTTVLNVPGGARSGGSGGGNNGGKKSKKKRSAGKIVAIVAGLLVLVLLVGGGIGYAIVANMLDGEKTEAGTLPEEVKTLPEYTGKGVVRMLVCGIDYDNETADGYTDENNKIGNTDLILYVVYDTVNNKVQILQMPRDVYVGEEVEAGRERKINGLYRYSEDPDNRMAALARVFNDQFGLPVDNYITLDMDALKAIIDHMGSIPVYVPIDVDFTDKDTGEYAIMEAGWRYLTSDQAEYFLRNRQSSTYEQKGDIMRLQMQQSFYSALFREFKQLSPGDLTMWMRILLYYSVTDMDPMQLAGLALKALNIEGSDITFVRPPVSGAAFTADDGKLVSLVSLVPDQTADLLNEYFRPEGQTLSVDDLDIHTLPVVETIGTHEASIRTMADVQSTEPPQQAA